MALRRHNDFDRDYWLGHCEGFQVRAGRRRLGFVEEVLDGGRVLAVRGGFLGRRVAHVPVSEVFAVVPRDLRIWLRTAPAVAVPKAPSLPVDDLVWAPRPSRRSPARIAA
jgi:hypothetical protein